MGLIQGLCDDVPPLLKSDIISLCSVLKTSKMPVSLMNRQCSPLPSTRFFTELDELKEPKRIKLDHTCDSIIEQLMTPIADTAKSSSSDTDKNIMSSMFVYSGDSKV